jgi:putative phosphoesterase
LKIGILSDSHGHVDRLRAAVQTLRTAGVETIVHCGDVGPVECLSVLAASAVPCYVVAGNMDHDVQALAEAAALHGVCFHERFVAVPLDDGRQLAVLHGHDVIQLNRLLVNGEYAYVCRGHTHKAADVRTGDVRVINPGGLHNCRPYTVAVLDTQTDDLQFLPVSLKP